MSFFEKNEIDWDPWILKDGDIYRAFYLCGDKKVDPWWEQGRIASAISPDMKHWQELGTILEPVPQNNWDSGRMLAGCTYKEDGVYYLFYGAASQEEMGKEKIGLAISTDGINWERY
ncbi:MAG: family 43 glycosylhydrolase, partial [Sphaerospermopsis sp. SIO1G2]|nr:family 43 glycosylhydrolase [Sphaerospermopsis sp. SIO1G2]